MNTTIKFFQTKDQYKAFRKAFAAAQNSPRAKKTFKEGVAEVWDSQTRQYSRVATKLKVGGWLTSEHFLLLNLVRGRPFYKGFTPKNSKAFIDNGGNVDRALHGAIQGLQYVVQHAKTLLDPTQINIPSWRKDKDKYIGEQVANAQKAVNAFLEVYDGTLTLQDLARVQVPNTLTTAGEKSYEELNLDVEDSVVEQHQPTPIVPSPEEQKAQLSFLAKVRQAVGM